MQDKDGFLPAPPHDESGHTWHHPDTGRRRAGRARQSPAGPDKRDDLRCEQMAVGEVAKDL